ncbi:ABC transporter permease [Kineosporia rhizophila]|uniref:ABC transporter permease n=1 Tax=Kineosporia TaxID=49184 RepID=UPI001E383ACD|nr:MULTISPECIES: ABC transporter permease [Kineosporia]MCE0536305.1 ABC transporter permease [Kineosporia rhizophila]GLY15109.1 peptide ABC transporter permease [Kineosporia sp. NBRC 101677]
MIRYTLTRIGSVVPTVLGAATVAFLLLRLIPGDPARISAGPTATPEQVEHLRSQLGLDQPWWSQYLEFLRNLFTGSLGTSTRSGNSVMAEISTRLPFTIQLAFWAMLIAIVVGCALGIVGALYRGRFVDFVFSAVSVVGVSAPVFWIGLMMIVLFSVKLGWFPASGAATPASVVLPACALSLFAIGFISRQTRSAMIDALSMDAIRTARAKGMSGFNVVGKQALRNALVPVITVVGLQFGQMLGGSILTESVFGWPGIGQLLVNSITNRDYPVVQGVVFVVAVMLILVNLATDLLYSAIDPRVRHGH